MKRFLLPTIVLGLSVLPIASATASANMVGAQALTAAAEPSAAVSKIYWRNGRWIGPGRPWGWRRPYWRRYGYYGPWWRTHGGSWRG
jgi:hypothetical protein